MSRTIFIHNKSGNNQEFEIHGWNENKNMVVKAHSTTTISARDGSSGAIIALHDGHEGEQAEITKKGFGGELPLQKLELIVLGSKILLVRLGNPSLTSRFIGRIQAMTSST